MSCGKREDPILGGTERFQQVCTFEFITGTF
jgi:hypothetical protein